MTIAVKIKKKQKKKQSPGGTSEHNSECEWRFTGYNYMAISDSTSILTLYIPQHASNSNSVVLYHITLRCVRRKLYCSSFSTRNWESITHADYIFILNTDFFSPINLRRKKPNKSLAEQSRNQLHNDPSIATGG